MIVGASYNLCSSISLLTGQPVPGGKKMTLKTRIKLDRLQWQGIDSLNIYKYNDVFNRPGVAGAVLQTASSLIESVIL